MSVPHNLLALSSAFFWAPLPLPCAFIISLRDLLIFYFYSARARNLLDPEHQANLIERDVKATLQNECAEGKSQDSSRRQSGPRREGTRGTCNSVARLLRRGDDCDEMTFQSTAE